MLDNLNAISFKVNTGDEGGGGAVLEHIYKMFLTIYTIKHFFI